MQNQTNSDWEAIIKDGFAKLEAGEKDVLVSYLMIGEGIGILIEVEGMAIEMAVAHAGKKTKKPRTTLRRAFDVYTHRALVQGLPSLRKALAAIDKVKAKDKPVKPPEVRAAKAVKDFQRVGAALLQTATPEDVPGLIRHINNLLTDLAQLNPDAAAAAQKTMDRATEIGAGTASPVEEAPPAVKRRGRPKKAEADAKVEAGWSAAERKATDAVFLNYVRNKLTDWPDEDRVSLVREASDKLRHMQPRGKPYRDELAAELSELFRQQNDQHLSRATR